MKFNGIDPRTLHPGISIAKEIPPGSVTSQIETLAGSTGEIVAGRTIQQGEYIVRTNIAGKTPEQAWEIRALLAGWAKAADAKTRKLIPTHWPKVSYDAIFKEISPPEFFRGFATVDIVFTLPRPIANSLQESIETGEGEVQITVGGTTWTRPSITITTGSTNGLTLSVDGKKLLALSGQYEENDFVFIYTDPPSVQLMEGGMPEMIDDRIDYTVTDFEAICEALTPGTHTIRAEGASVVSVSWRDAWL